MKLAVVGDPVDHSLSPAIHTAAMRAAGIAGSYTRVRVDASGLAAVAEDIRRGGLDGVNVTMPHKAVAAALVDHTAGSAGRMGTVNTITRVGDRLIGHNTDVAGIVAAWATAGLPVDRPVLVLGSGGAAAAALVGLETLRVAQVRLAGRRPEALQELADGLGVSVLVEPIGSRGVDGAVVVNATPLGMSGEPLPVKAEESAGLFDMAYGRAPTPAVEAARAAGVPVVDGVAMLIAQAAESFRLWTGRAADLDAMAEAAAAAMLHSRVGP